MLWIKLLGSTGTFSTAILGMVSGCTFAVVDIAEGRVDHLLVPISVVAICLVPLSSGAWKVGNALWKIAQFLKSLDDRLANIEKNCPMCLADAPRKKHEGK